MLFAKSLCFLPRPGCTLECTHDEPENMPYWSGSFRNELDEGIISKVSNACAQDFHSAIEGALSDEDYVSELYEAMLEEGSEALERGMELTAQRTVRKAKVKVTPWLFSAARSLLCTIIQPRSHQRRAP